MGDGTNLVPILWRHLWHVLPAVHRELDFWQRRAAAIPNLQLRSQALASINWKRFHCEGGAVYAARSGPYRRELLQFIVALQTISDYLDNLCDRAGVLDAAAFRLLHQAMLDAVALPGTEQPGFTQTSVSARYYGLYPYNNDGGYLSDLVATCQRCVSALPFYYRVQPAVHRLVSLYCDLQVYKHIALAERVPTLTAWFAREWSGAADLQWQEFAAAAGSTLGVFALCDMAAGPAPPLPEPLIDLYFPWVCGLHILLDYLIDLEEDRAGGDLNFVSYYHDLAEAETRMSRLYKAALARVGRQACPAVHAAALHGLPALYLSDAKVQRQGQQQYARRLLRTGGGWAAGLYTVCRIYRRLSGENAGTAWQDQPSVITDATVAVESKEKAPV